MDADRFDDLTVAIGTDRRALVGGLLAGAVAALVGLGGTVEAGLTKCAAPGEACKKTADCCDTGCKKKRGKKKGKCKKCPDGTVFFGLQCFCANGNGQLPCNGVCCQPGQVCEGGSCADCPATTCDEGFTKTCSTQCSCMTSSSGANHCVDNEGAECADCDSDDDCTTFLGRPGLCVSGCSSCPNGTGCVRATCPDIP